MSNTDDNTTQTDQGAQNAFNTYMALRERGIDKDKAFRASDHIKIATNKDGDKGAAAAAVQILRWLGLFALIIVLLIGYANYASANTIYMPSVAQRCNPCAHSIPMPTATATPVINEPPMPTAEVQ